MAVDPSQHRILLVGPRVIHLKSYFERRRYNVVAVQKGVEGMGQLDTAHQDVVILELNLGDLTATEFLMAARQQHVDSSFLLLDDASKAGQIVKALQAGLDGYLPTPPDEDRLFFEVERHLRKGLNGTPTTEVAIPQPMITDAQAQLADRDSQLLEIGVQVEMLQQELKKARDDLKKLAAVKHALSSAIDGDLDEAAANKLRERLAMGTVLETENETLRDELSAARSTRRELQEQIDHLKGRVAELDAAAKNKDDSMEGFELKERASELESENMVLEGKIAELEKALEQKDEDVQLAKAEVVAFEEKHKSEVAELKRELNRIASEQAMKEGDLERKSMEAQRTIAKLEEDHQRAVAELRKRAESAVDRAHTEIEEKSTAIEQRLLEETKQRLADAEAAAKKRERDLEERHQFSVRERDAIIKQKDEAIAAALMEKEQAVDKSLDVELQMEDLKIKIELLESQVKKAEDRAKKAEADFKKEKIRLIEEKEVVATGSEEAFNKIQRFVDENASLKRLNAELESNKTQLEERAKKGDEAAKQAEIAIARADELEKINRNLSERFGSLEVSSTDKIKSLEQRLAATEARLKTAEEVSKDAGSTAAKLADARAALSAAEREADRLSKLLHDTEHTAVTSTKELQSARMQASGTEAMVGEMQERIRSLEKELLTLRQGGGDDVDAVRLQASTDRQALVDHYEQRLRDALVGSPNEAAAAAIAERDAYRARLAETEEWVRNATLHLEALRTERDQLAAQASALAADGQQRMQDLQAQTVNELRAEMEIQLAAQLDEQRTQLQAQMQAQVQSQVQAQVAELSKNVDARAQVDLEQQLAAEKQRVLERVAESKLLHDQLARATEQIAKLHDHTDLLEAQLDELRRQPTQTSMVDPSAYAAVQDELRAVRQQLATLQQQAGSVRLPDELEPLRWTLTAAIDALSVLEGREPVIAGHLRNLRLLASTLQKLQS